MIDHRRQRVLIVDDDASIRRMLALSLEREGYRTTAACDGGEALEVMRQGEVDLVLLDLMMPNVTGWEVLAERAVVPELRTIPVIVVTAARGDGVATIPPDAICAVLAKPFELETLRTLVKNCLEGRTAAVPTDAGSAPGSHE